MGKTNAVEGLYRLYVANGSKGIPVDFPMSLNKGTVYTAVLRYSTHDAISTLWVNPVHEDSPSVTARDALNPPLPVTAVGFRQSDGLGPEVWIDELKVGSSFRAVTAPVTPAPYLRYEQTPAGLELRWNQGESLQRASSAAGPFEDVTGAQSPFRVEPSMSGTAAFFRLKMKTDLPGSLSGL